MVPQNASQGRPEIAPRHRRNACDISIEQNYPQRQQNGVKGRVNSTHTEGVMMSALFQNFTRWVSRVRSIILASLSLIGVAASVAYGQAGTEGASFLDIPVGGRPAALGGAYAAQAFDAYAPVYNPAGLGFLQRNELAGMHLSYLDSINYEYLSFAHPLTLGHSFATSIQYLRPGDIAATDNVGNSIGSFSGSYASYNLAYGQMIGERLAVGATGKLIRASIGAYSANAYGLDFGTMYVPMDHLTLAALVDNMGTKLTFLNDGDRLPLAGKLAASYAPTSWISFHAQGEYDAIKTTTLRGGLEWRPTPMIALRGGYKTDTTKQLSPLAGVTAGLGLHLFGQEFDYAWVPLGDLGNTQYFSLLFKWGESDVSKRGQRNLIRFVENHHANDKPASQKDGFWSVYDFDEYQLPSESSLLSQPKMADGSSDKPAPEAIK